MASVLIASLVLALGMPAQSSAPPQDPEIASAVASFDKHIREFLELKADAADTVAPIRDPKDPREILIASAALADAIRIRRAGAQVGDIFSKRVQAAFRLIIVRSIQRHGDAATDLLARTKRETIPGGKPPAVNQYFPWQLGAMMPPYLLEDLPSLPKDLQYRIVGADLILFDLDSNLVLDILKDAFPDAAVRGGR